MTRLRIVIDCTQACLDPHSGLRTYQHELVRGLARVAGDEHFVLLHSLRPHKRRAEPVRVDDPRFQTLVVPLSKWGMQRWDVVSRWRLHRAVGPVDVWHATMLERRLPYPAAHVVTCHDLCSLRLPADEAHYATRPPASEALPPPQAYPPVQPWMRRVAQTARAILTCSQSTRQDLHRALGVPVERITVTPYAAAPRPPTIAPRSTLPAPLPDRPYCVQLASVSPRKNVPRMMQAFARFVRQASYPGLLVIAGGLGSLDQPLREEARATGLAERFLFIGFTDDLSALIHHADAFLYPSLCEGFGFPILEAMAFGAPVLASRTTSMPEVGGDDVVWVDPRDVEDMARGLARVIAPEERPRRLAAGLERLRHFTWDHTARLTLEVYRRVADQPMVNATANGT